jgi:hypothetical protein
MFKGLYVKNVNGAYRVGGGSILILSYSNEIQTQNYYFFQTLVSEFKSNASA